MRMNEGDETVDWNSNEDLLIDMAELFKVFGDSTRIKILCELFQEEKCVSDICQAVQMGQSAVSHQLRILKQAKLVRGRRQGKQIFYALADHHVEMILNMTREHLEGENCDEENL